MTPEQAKAKAQAILKLKQQTNQYQSDSLQQEVQAKSPQLQASESLATRGSKGEELFESEMVPGSSFSKHEDPYGMTAPRDHGGAIKIVGGLWNAGKNLAKTAAAGFEEINQAVDPMIEGIQNPIFQGAARVGKSLLNPVGSVVPDGTAQAIDENIPSYTNEGNAVGQMITEGTEIAAGMAGPMKMMKIGSVQGLPRLFANLGKFVTVNAGGTAALDEDVETLITGENAAFGNLLGGMALDKNGEYSEELLKKRLNVLYEASVLTKPLEMGARSVATTGKFLLDQTYGKLAGWSTMAAKERQAAEDVITELIDIGPDDTPEMIAAKTKQVSDKIRGGSKVNIETGNPGVRDINYRRPTMEAFVKGGGGESGIERARASSLESSAIARGLPELEAASAKPALELERVTDDTRKVFGGKENVEEARKSVLESADNDVKNFDTEVSRQTNDLETYKKDSTDLVKDDEFLGKTVRSGEGKIQLDLRSRTNEVTDNIVKEHNTNKADITKISDDNFKKIPDEAPADMDSFNQQYEEVKDLLPKDIQELIEKNDGSYGYLKKKINPELSLHIDELLTANPKSRAGHKLRALRDNISKDQFAKLMEDGNLVTAKAAKDADEFFKEQAIPYRQGTSDELTRIEATKGRKRPDEAVVESRAALKSAFNDPDKAEYTNRVLELVPDPKLKGDYILANFAEEVSDTIATKGIEGLDSVQFVKRIRQYTPMLEPDQARRVEAFINNIESKKLTTKQMTEQLDLIKKETEGFENKIYKGELKKFFDEDGLPNMDGDQVFGEYLSDDKGGNKIKQLVNRIKSTGNPVALDGLKAAYSKKLEDAFRGGKGAAGEKNINENANLEKLFEYGDIIHADNPKIMNMFRSLQKEAVDSASFRNAKKATMSDINKFDKDARSAFDFGITMVFGQLNRWGARLRSVAGRAVSGQTAKQENLQAIGAIFSDPEKAANLIEQIGKDKAKGLSSDTRRKIFDWAVLNGLYDEEQRDDFLSNINSQTETAFE